MPSLMDLVEKVKRETDPAKVGMIACHNGVVRATTRAGEPAEYLDVEADEEILERILGDMRTRPGIAAVEAHAISGRRHVGDDLLYIVVAGDIRENVLPVLGETLDRVKAEAVRKREKLGRTG